MQRVTAYKTDDGKFHETEIEAAKHGFDALLDKTLKGVITSPSIRKDIANILVLNGYDVLRTLSDVIRLTPKK